MLAIVVVPNSFRSNMAKIEAWQQIFCHSTSGVDNRLSRARKDTAARFGQSLQLASTAPYEATDPTLRGRNENQAQAGPGKDVSWSTSIDEPSPDDLPSRDIRDGSVGFDTPFARGQPRVQRVATSAISTASTLGDLAGTVFRPATAQRAESESASLAVADERARGEFSIAVIP